MPIKLPQVLTANHNLMQKLSVFCLITVAFITATLGYWIDVNSLQKKLQQLQKQVTAAQIQISTQGFLHKQLAELNAQNKKLNAEYLSYHIKNSGNIELSTFLKDIFNAANKNHIEIISIAPSNSKSNEHDAAQIVNMEFNGKYQQIAQFINSFAQLKLATYIQILSIQRSIGNEIDAKLSAKLSLLLYGFHYKTSKQKIIIKRDPFDQDTAANQADLTKWSCEDLRLIGVLAQDDQTIGVVKDPEGFIHYLTLSDTIGVNHSKITKITTNAIITDNPSANIYREN